MRQRNPGPYTLTVPTISADVEPGEEVDYPDLIAGFVIVDIHPDTPPIEPPPAEPDKPARKTTASKAAVTASSTEEA